MIANPSDLRESRQSLKGVSEERRSAYGKGGRVKVSPAWVVVVETVDIAD